MGFGLRSGLSLMADEPRWQNGYQPSVGELARSLGRIEKQLDALTHKVEANFVNRAYYETRHQELQTRILDLESTNKWIVRTMFGFVLALAASATSGVVYAVIH